MIELIMTGEEMKVHLVQDLMIEEVVVLKDGKVLYGCIILLNLVLLRFK